MRVCALLFSYQMFVFVQSCCITLITHTSFTFYLTDEMKHKKATTGAHPVLDMCMAHTMAHNNKITSWKIYLVKKMTHIRSEIIMHAYNFCLLLLVHRAAAWKDVYVRRCADFFLSTFQENGVKWYMTGRMFWIYCDYYIFLSFGYCCCCLFHCQAKSSIVPEQQCNGNKQKHRREKRARMKRLVVVTFWFLRLAIHTYIHLLVCVNVRTYLMCCSRCLKWLHSPSCQCTQTHIHMHHT